MIDENISWNAQVDQITKKVNSGLSILRRLRDSRFQNINHNIFINNIYNLTLTIARRFGAFWVNDYLIEQGRPSTILDKIVWQNVFCFPISHHMRTCLLYIKFSARSSLPLHQCCNF